MFSLNLFLLLRVLNNQTTALFVSNIRKYTIKYAKLRADWIQFPEAPRSKLSPVSYVVCHDDVIKPTIMFGKVSLKLSMKLLPKHDYFDRKLKL